MEGFARSARQFKCLVHRTQHNAPANLTEAFLASWDFSSLQGRRLLAALAQRAHATGADIHAELDAVHHQALALDVRLEGAVGAPLREADVVSEGFGFSTEIALPGHDPGSLSARSASRRLCVQSCAARRVSPDTNGLEESTGAAALGASRATKTAHSRERSING